MSRPGQKSCDRCGDRRLPFVTPYWDEEKGYCAQCCFELNHQYDAEGWPELGESLPETPEATKMVRPGLTFDSYPTQLPRSA